MKVRIERLDHQGRGIAYIDNKITFIAQTLPDEIVECEIVEAKKNYNEGIATKILESSKKRTTPMCPYFNICGGCHLQHISYLDSLEYKKAKVENILEREKIIFPTLEVIQNDFPKYYRNKITLKIEDGKIGFYEEKSHHLTEIKKCYLAKESINACLPKIKTLQIKKGNITIRSNYNDEILLIINTNDKIDFQEENFSDIILVGVVLNDKTIYGDNFFYERVNGFLFKVSYDAFFQVNPFITQTLFDIIKQNVEESKNVLDLYAGVGTLGIVASKKANKVYSIEIIKNAVLDATINRKLNKCDNVYPLLGDASIVLPKIQDTMDTILIDPPRKGLDKNSLEILMKSNAKKIIYISCDPMTLARDLKTFQEKYEIEKFYVLDMFSYTYHIESVCVLKLY